MEMYYDGMLVLPSGYIVMNEEEMAYVDGGFYISNKAITSFVIACGICQIPAALIGIGLYKLGAFLTAKAGILGAKIGGVLGGIFGSLVGGLVSALIGAAAAFTIARACIEGKGIGVDVRKTLWGQPYWVEINVR